MDWIYLYLDKSCLVGRGLEAYVLVGSQVVVLSMEIK